jgi:hypothetical protein
VENYERTSERFSLEESYDRAVCMAERNGLVGRPRIQVTVRRAVNHIGHCFLSLDIGNENHIGVLVINLCHNSP